MKKLILIYLCFAAPLLPHEHKQRPLAKELTTFALENRPPKSGEKSK